MVENINNLPNAKYKQVPNDVEKNSKRSDPSREKQLKLNAEFGIWVEEKNKKEDFYLFLSH